MDLKYLFKRRDASMLRARNAATEMVRSIHFTLAEAYASLIVVATDAPVLSRLAS